jgi:hypothetical protein
VRGAFTVEETTGPRWELALDLLRAGKAVAIGHVTLRRVDPCTVEATVASSWQPERVDEERARRDLEDASRWIGGLLADDESFRDVIGASKVDFVLVDDYDTGAVALCRLDGDRIVWMT